MRALNRVACLCGSAVLLLATACGDDTSSPSNTQPPRAKGGQRVTTIDERRGTYRGVGIGSTRREAAAELGRPRTGPSAPLAPLGEQPLLIGVPPDPVVPRRLHLDSIWRFKGAAMVTDRGRAWMLTVSAKDARTRRDIGVGDNLDAVRDGYRDAECAVANEGTEYVSFPYCTAPVGPRRYVWFGYDPIRSVTLSVAPLT